MRDIKFRAFLIDSHQWVYGGGIMRFKDGALMIGADSEGRPVIHQVNPESASQFIDSHDKNGKEIWEGDVVARIEVDWDNVPDDEPEGFVRPVIETMRDVVTLERFRYWLKNESLGYEGEDFVDPSYCEVIGNIYENPELLK